MDAILASDVSKNRSIRAEHVALDISEFESLREPLNAVGLVV